MVNENAYTPNGGHQPLRTMYEMKNMMLLLTLSPFTHEMNFDMKRNLKKKSAALT